MKNGLLPKDEVGAAAFPLKTYLINSYPGVNLSAEEKVFNYRLSCAKRIVKKASVILISRFPIFIKALPTNLDVVDEIILQLAYSILGYEKI